VVAVCHVVTVAMECPIKVLFQAMGMAVLCNHVSMLCHDLED
tara:strand:- start:8546 stop:8671 length:126 start_codon:yes stop_codon:yes gene_type:complete